MTVQSEDAVRVRRINADDAHTAVDDALADLLHVYDGDGSAVIDYVLGQGLGSGARHYQAEKAGEDGARIEVLR